MLSADNSTMVRGGERVNSNSGQTEMKPVIHRNPKGYQPQKRPKTTVTKCVENLGQNEGGNELSMCQSS